MHHTRLHFPSIDSTHAYALAHADELAQGAIITADVQTDGVGRAGRTWVSGESDSLLLSLVLKDATDPDAAKLLTPIMALAALRLLAEFGVEARIKWPNDVIVRDKKCAGILSTSAYVGDAIAHVVVSIGLNVTQKTDALAAIDIPATSLGVETGAERTPDALLEPLMAQFDALYEAYNEEGFAPLLTEWRAAQLLMGKKVGLKLGNEQVEGEVTAFGDDGTIELTLSNGEKNAYQMGEVVKVF